MWNIAEQTLTPFSTGRASDISPVWTEDGRSIVFARGRAVAPAVLRKPTSAARPTETLSAFTDSLVLPGSLSPDAALLVVTASVATGFDLQVLNLAGTAPPEPLVATSFDELNGEISPDGRWLAYQSRQSGQFEIWVRRFDRLRPTLQRLGPLPPGPLSGLAAPRPRQVSDQGGTRPVWARSGRELFYLTVGNRMMAVPVSSGDDFKTDRPVELFAVPIYADLVGRTFDVSPDGRRFLAVMELMRTK
jgi:serine/threonine-protein kinase